MGKPRHRAERDGASTRPAGGTVVVRLSPVVLGLGSAFLLVSLAAALMLVLDHLGGLSLPGCGPKSACAEVTSGKWGKIPLGAVNWPVSHFGLAYFAALLTAWLSCGRGVPAGLRNLVRIGALGSLGFCALLIAGRHICYYCLGVHLGNFAFWILLETSATALTKSIRPLAALAGVFIIATGALGIAEWSTQRAVDRTGEQQLAQSTAEIIRVTQGTRATPTQPATGSAATSAASVVTSSQASATTTAAAGDGSADDYPYKNGFRGRYLRGPEQAAVRLVMITDYQCPDCRKLEDEARTLLQQHPDMSLSVKNFPFSTKCNPRVDRDLHPNACFAARAAEAAGILWGNDGFWVMHDWLFEHKGVFTTRKEMEDAMREKGYDPANLISTMTGDETARRVKADIDEAFNLGIFQTPMIFINGVELRGWIMPKALTRAVEAVLATSPPPQTHAVDHPPLALEKSIGDWAEQLRRPMPPGKFQYPIGPDGAKVSIVIWGDYQEPATAEADAIVRNWVANRSDAQYTFRHYPFNQECNSNVPSTKFAQSCWAARVAQAAGRLGGADAYWRVHLWLMSHQQSFTDDALRQAAGELGLDVGALLAATSAPDVADAIRTDVDAGGRLNLPNIPSIVLNGRLIPRWRHPETERSRLTLEAILNAAAKK
jgi:protein-disulfide isomerase/uncharacterized membrane protein